MPKHTLETYTTKAATVHGERYTVIALDHSRRPALVRAACSIHGEFTRQASQLLMGKGCPLCGYADGGKRKTHGLETVVEKAKLVHGDTYKYLAKTRENGTSWLSVECPTHGVFRQREASHLGGSGCPSCATEATQRSLRTTLQQVVERAKVVHASKNYEYLYLDFEDRNVASVNFICLEHGQKRQRVSNHFSGGGCPDCGKHAAANSRRYTLEAFRAKAAERYGDRYTYKRLEYKNNVFGHIVFDCPDHGEQKQSVTSHLRSVIGCEPCSVKSTGLLARYSLDTYIAKATAVHGNKYLYISINYDTVPFKINYVCQEHGLQNQIGGNHIQGQGCPLCGRAAAAAAKRYEFEDYVVKAREVHGDLYDYTGLKYEENADYTFARVHFVCKKHGRQVQRAKDHLSGGGCPDCKNPITKPALEIQGFLDSVEVSTDLEYKFPNSRKPFDILVHTRKLVVEYNGNYWHSSQYISSDKHLQKTRIAEANGYRCIHIRSDEWENKRTAVEYLLKSAAGKVSEKVYARKTQVVKPSKLEASRMLDTYHIQGSVAYGEFYGLEEAGQLVAVMVFSRNTSSRREKASDSHVELTRYVTCKQVVGGFTKLLNAFLKDNPEVLTVSSYSDVRIFQGGVYEKAGFVKMHTTSPDYMYLEKDRLYHKAGYQKSKLAKRFGTEACEGKTERQITEEQGIFRVYDCGKTKWLYTRK